MTIASYREDCLVCLIRTAFECPSCKKKLCFECGVLLRLQIDVKVRIVPCPRCKSLLEQGWDRVGETWEHSTDLDPEDHYRNGLYKPLEPKI